MAAWAWRHRFLLSLLAASIVFYGFFYFQTMLRPGAVFPLGWNGWADQGEYMKEARAIRQWDLSDHGNYVYPMGYPLAAVPFLGVLPAHPFFPVNIAAYVTVIGLFYSTATRWVAAPVAFVGGILMMLATPLTILTVIPWTSTPALLATTYWLYVAVGRRRLTYPGVVIGALLFGWMYTARGGGELVLLGPFAVAFLWSFRKERGLVWKGLIALVILGTVAVLNALWTHAIFDQWFHPYLNAVKRVGFDAKLIPDALWATLFVGGPEAQWHPGLFVQAFWLLLFPIGVYLACRRRDAVLHLGLIGSVVVGIVVTCAFDNFGAESLKYYSLHYVKLWFPILGLYALIALDRFIALKGEAPGDYALATRARSSS